MNDGDLERRALAAAAAARAEREAREREEKRRRDEEERRRLAEAERAAREGAVRKLEEVLGHRTNPSEWGIWSGYTVRYSRVPISTFATLSLLGVPIRGNENGLEEYLYPNDKDLREDWWKELTLVSFGRALENRSRKDW